jgi:regulator of cell morphogenesis and NO signaling
MTISPGQSVRQIVVEHPEAITVLEQYGIDYCGGNADTLAEACSKRDLDSTLVIEALSRQQQSASTVEGQWQNVPLKKIIEFIVNHHHVFARRQLDLIRGLATVVERRHGNKHPELFQLSDAVAAISTELEFHFFWQETILFPYISLLGAGQAPESSPTCVYGREPVDHVLTDHKHTRNELWLLRELSNNYLPPADACTSYRALYRALEDFEKDLNEHIHLENYILFPRVFELTPDTCVAQRSEGDRWVAA